MTLSTKIIRPIFLRLKKEIKSESHRLIPMAFLHKKQQAVNIHYLLKTMKVYYLSKVDKVLKSSYKSR